ncbi:MAG TPA: hydantoinase B/oxoprolinase family protein [Chloroflexota bacterium]|nr:hydantoinase B/oxoprolinase family protein [Chloroflexota bacterium]
MTPSAQSAGADVVTVGMLRSNLEALLDEMYQLLVRSAYSTIMRESRDCSYLVVDDQGRVILTTSGNYSHAPSYRRIVRNILQKFGRGGLQADDVIITNHPYLGGVPHTPDLAVVVPVFVDDELTAFSCSIAHKPDFGGSVPGSASSSATELYQEGFLLPPTKLYVAGQYQQAIEDILVANVRHPDLVLGDARAQIGTTRVAAQRVVQLVHRYGLAETRAVFEELLRIGEQRLRAALRTWSDGTTEVSGFLDDDGVRLDVPVRFHVRITVTGDTIHFDFSGSDDQAVGPVNVPPQYGEMATFYALLAMADPQLTFNDGLREPVTLTFREGSVLNPRMPAPVGAATVCSYRLTDIVLEALGHFNPASAVAHSGGSGGAMAISWQAASPEQRPQLQYEIFGTGLGGRHGSDGVDGVAGHSTNLGVAPIEILETQFPLRVRRFELIRDSAGPGEFRGGLSYRRDYELLREASLNRRADRIRFPGEGIDGGQPGKTGRLVLNPETPDERVLRGSGQHRFAAGSVVRFEGAGAGGCGDPLRREPTAVERDVRAGYVSVDAARDSYGVVVDPASLKVDAAATEGLRRALRSQHEEEIQA